MYLPKRKARQSLALFLVCFGSLRLSARDAAKAATVKKLGNHPGPTSTHLPGFRILT